MTAPPPSGCAPRLSQRLPDKILLAFHQACDGREFEIAAALLRCCQAAMEVGNLSTHQRRRDDEELILAFERLWFLRHEAGMRDHDTERAV